MIDIRKLKELVRLMVENDLSELDLKDQQETVTISGSGSGAFEDPKVGGGAVGYATCTLNRTTKQIDCTARIYNIVDLIAAHLHVTGPGIAGPVALPIPNLPLRISNDFGLTWAWTESNLARLPRQGINSMDDVLETCSSGNCYLNFHTVRNPDGEVRVNMCPDGRESNTIVAIDVCHPDRIPPTPTK